MFFQKTLKLNKLKFGLIPNYKEIENSIIQSVAFISQTFS